MPSRQRRADIRWVRWNVSPMKLRVKAVVRVKCVGVIR